jgi:hypothetical protein
MTEQTFYRVSAVAGFAIAVIGLAVTLGLTVTAWLGWAVLVGCLFPVAMKLINMEREQRLDERRAVVAEPGPWVEQHEQV